MDISEELVEAVKDFEGCKLYAYRDSGGTLTIGYGHTRGVKAGQAITQAQADEWLRQDLEAAMSQVEGLGLTGLGQTQKEALADFTFNLGIGNLRQSTLLRYIKAGKGKRAIYDEFMRWVYSKGKVLGGLVKRRRWEALRYTDAMKSKD